MSNDVTDFLGFSNKGAESAQKKTEQANLSAQQQLVGGLVPGAEAFAFNQARNFVQKGFGQGQASLQQAADRAFSLGDVQRRRSSDAFQQALSGVSGGAIGAGLAGSTIEASGRLGAAGRFSRSLANIDQAVGNIQTQILSRKAGLEVGEGNALAQLTTQEYQNLLSRFGQSASIQSGLQFIPPPPGQGLGQIAELVLAFAQLANSGE